MIAYLNSILSEHLAYAISWTVIHSLWQASLIALIMSWFLNRYKHEDAIIRYRITYAALVFVFLGSLLTFVFYYCFNLNASEEVVHSQYAATLMGTADAQSGTIISQMGSWLSHNVELFASMWVLGVMLFSVKLAGSYVFVSQLKRQNTDFIPDNVYKGFIEIKNKLGIQEYVHLAESARINTPMLIGYIKPVILFPIGLINHLSVEETQAILAHELAHIKRNDFLHNLILSLIEMLFYYHPAVWWISANVRMERENCCDDVAMKLIGDKTIYAKTLLKIEELKTTKIPSLAIPLSRNKNQLLHRISRIVNQSQTRSQIRERLVATCLLFTFFFGFGSTAMDSTSKNSFEVPELDHKIVAQIVKDCDKQLSPVLLKKNHEKGDCNCDTVDKRFVNVSVSNLSTENRDFIYIDTIPSGKRSNMTIINSGEDQEVILRMKDGKIIELTVDGEEVNEEDYDDHLSQSIDVEKMVEKAREQSKSIRGKWDKDHFQLLENHEFQHEKLFNQNENNELIFPKRFEYYFDSTGKERRLFENDSERELMEKLTLKLADKKFYEFEGREAQMEELLEKMDKSNFHQFDFEEGLGFIDSIHFNGPNLDSLFERMQDLGNGIVEFDSSIPRLYQINNDVPRWESFGQPIRNPTDKLMKALSDDGFIDGNTENTIELSGKHLKINGEKQPSNIFNKYKKMFESLVGHPLTKSSKIRIDYEKELDD